VSKGSLSSRGRAALDACSETLRGLLGRLQTGRFVTISRTEPYEPGGEACSGAGRDMSAGCLVATRYHR